MSGFVLLFCATRPSPAQVCAMAATLVCALALHNPMLVLVCILVQFGAMAWYILSYIPFGRRMATNLANRFM